MADAMERDPKNEPKNRVCDESGGRRSFAQLCPEYGISRKTGYKWRERFVAQGWDGMEEESRRPHGHSEALDEATVCRIVRLKEAHPHWGPRKIRELYGANMEANTQREQFQAGIGACGP